MAQYADPTADAQRKAAETISTHVDALNTHRRMAGSDLVADFQQTIRSMGGLASDAKQQVTRILKNDQVPVDGRVNAARRVVNQATATIEELASSASTVARVMDAQITANAIPQMPKDADAVQAREEFKIYLDAADGDVALVMQRLGKSGDPRLASLALGTYGQALLDADGWKSQEAATLVRAAILASDARIDPVMAAGAEALKTLGLAQGAADGQRVLAMAEIAAAESSIQALFRGVPETI